MASSATACGLRPTPPCPALSERASVPPSNDGLLPAWGTGAPTEIAEIIAAAKILKFGGGEEGFRRWRDSWHLLTKVHRRPHVASLSLRLSCSFALCLSLSVSLALAPIVLASTAQSHTDRRDRVAGWLACRNSTADLAATSTKARAVFAGVQPCHPLPLPRPRRSGP